MSRYLISSIRNLATSSLAMISMFAVVSGCFAASEIPVGTGESVKERIAEASEGDTIVISPGVTIEPLLIRKSIHLRGSGSGRVDCGPLIIQADDVTVENLAPGGDDIAVMRIERVSGVTIRNCLIRNTNRDHLGYGLKAQTVSNLVIENCRVHDNSVGLLLAEASGVHVSGCDIRNDNDGIIIADESRDIEISDCYIHRHQGQGRPGAHADGIQTFRTVDNLTIRNCQLLGNMQHMHFESTTGILIEDCICFGSSANGVSFAWRNTTDATITRSTLGYSGLSLLNMTAHGYSLTENILVSGHSKPCLVTIGVDELVSDENLFWNTVRADSPMMAASEVRYHRDFSEYQEASGYDQNSVYTDPGFANAPLAIASINPKRFNLLTHSWIPIWGHIAMFQVGDTIEIGFDGVVRKCLEIRDEGIVIDPPLAELPSNAVMVTTWGENENLQLNLSRPGQPNGHRPGYVSAEAPVQSSSK
ncbi:Glycosyl hydrolases family 28 [Thalassoglobus neptunius]|uniref:Glycosyl hydrolases family 28 n=1 Tax=Thalassoglobus neptunius TaxID=1938619 RepID=A0A5C5WY79_9PLAN|nr:right-handed parallel beta-helix repeat-containing protein [Thalassoglobus neptunius]TWT55637.1 Glycosyl hydrolases family 28 [Thalassoglobus neptunius]